MNPSPCRPESAPACGADHSCVAACPGGAILDSRNLPSRFAASGALNRDYFQDTAHG